MATVSREELYDLVWSQPMRTLCAQFGMSDVGLKKHCVKLEVPVPERGYWNKLQAGKRVVKTRLPPRGPGMPNSISIGPDPSQRWPYDPEAILAEPLPVEPTFDEPIESVRQRVTARVGRVRRERDLSSPHPEIRKLLEADEKRRAKQQESPYLRQYYEPFFGSAFEQRRLKVLNSLFIALARSGGKPAIRGESGRELSVAVGGQSVSFQMDHPAAKANRHGEWGVRPGKADRLALSVGGAREDMPRTVWSETDGRTLDQQMSEIVVGLIVRAEMQYRQGVQRSHQWRLERRTEAEKELRKRRAEAEKQARETRLREEREARIGLLEQATALRDAGEIRALVAAVQTQAERLDQHAVQTWVSWASGVADRIDPLRNVAVADGSLRFSSPEDRAAQDAAAGAALSNAYVRD